MASRVGKLNRSDREEEPMTLHELLLKLPLTDEQKATIPGPDGSVSVAVLLDLLTYGGWGGEAVTLPLSVEVATATPSFGSRLRALRLAKGWKQQQLAEAAGVPKQSLVDYEGGRRNPSLGNASKLAKALGVTVDSMLEMS